MPEVLNLLKWFEDNKDEMKPPVGNKIIANDQNWILMGVQGPNTRRDFHFHERGPEFFYMARGEMTLKIQEPQDDKLVPKDVVIKEGELYLMAANTIHSPRRPAGSWGFVIEKKAEGNERDWLHYYCEKCNNKLGEFEFQLKNIVTELPPIFDKFFNSDMRKCGECGTVMERPD